MENAHDYYVVVIPPPFCTPGTFVSGTTCQTCPVGQYASTYDALACSTCSINTYQDGTTPDQCQPCGNGKYQPLPGQSTCLPCHPFCKKCFGNSQSQCNQCWEDIPQLLSVIGTTCDCQDGFFYDSAQAIRENYCQQCHILCRKCTDQDHCSECVDPTKMVLENGVCKCIGIYREYFNQATQTWGCTDQCHPLCTQCYGPSNDQCMACDAAKGGVMVAPNKCNCPKGYFFDILVSKCAKCYGLCEDCVGPQPDQCVTCNSSIALSVEGDPTLCVSSCPDGFFKSGSVCKSSGLFFCASTAKN